MNIDLSRCGFPGLAGAGAAATTLGAMGFGAPQAAELIHVEGDADNPRNRGTLCPGARH